MRNLLFLETKAAHVRAQIAALERRETVAVLDDADLGPDPVAFQRERLALLEWLRTADDASVQEKRESFERLAGHARRRLERRRSLAGVPAECVTAQAFVELIDHVMTEEQYA